MSDIRTPWEASPSPIDISIYQASDQPLLFYPYGTDITKLPANWATDYSYRLSIFDESSPSSSIDFTGTNDGSTGLTTFTIPRATRLTWSWTAKKYDCSEIVAAAVVDVPAAGEFNLLVRGSV